MVKATNIQEEREKLMATVTEKPTKRKVQPARYLVQVPATVPHDDVTWVDVVPLRADTKTALKDIKQMSGVKRARVVRLVKDVAVDEETVTRKHLRPIT